MDENWRWRRKRLTFEGYSITANGSDGVIDVIFSLQGRIDLYHLKVHGYTAEPTDKTQGETKSQLNFLLFAIFIPTWTLPWRD